MLISFCVAIYNVEKYLNECIDSILSQTDNDYEVLLIDDGSKDDSGLICDKYQNNDKVRIFHNSHLGVSDTRNMAIKEARGQWIFYVDGDDVVSKYVCETLRNVLRKETCPIIQFKSDTFYENNRNVFKKSTKCETENVNSIYALEKSIYNDDNIIDNKYHLATVWGKLYNRIYLLSNNLKFNKDCIYAQDLVFNIGAYSCTKEVTVVDSECLYGYRINEMSIGRRYNNGLSIHTPAIINAFNENLNKYLDCDVISEMKEEIANRIFVLATKPLIADIFNLKNRKPYLLKKKEFDRIFKLDAVCNSLQLININKMQGTQKMLCFFIKNNMFCFVYIYYLLLQYKEQIRFLN